MYALTIIAIVIAGSLLIGAVIFGLLRNNKTKAPATSGNSNNAPESRR